MGARVIRVLKRLIRRRPRKTKDEQFLEDFVDGKADCYVPLNVFEDSNLETFCMIKLGPGASGSAAVVFSTESDALEFAAVHRSLKRAVKRCSFDALNTLIGDMEEKMKHSVTGFATVVKVPKGQSPSGYHVTAHWPLLRRACGS